MEDASAPRDAQHNTGLTPEPRDTLGESTADHVLRHTDGTRLQLVHPSVLHNHCYVYLLPRRTYETSCIFRRRSRQSGWRLSEGDRASRAPKCDLSLMYISLMVSPERMRYELTEAVLSTAALPFQEEIIRESDHPSMPPANSVLGAPTRSIPRSNLSADPVVAATE